MISKKTVFVLSAGASWPYGFPTTQELRRKICQEFPVHLEKLISGEGESSVLRRAQVQEAKELSAAFSTSSTQSIDLFLARNHKFSEIGKMAIVLCILQAEDTSCFREDMKHEKQDWYSYLFARMTEQLIEPESFKLFGKNKVAFITFNYDRSLEHFLYESLSNSFGSAPKEKIIDELNKIPIFHVYGKVAKLLWQGKGIDYRAVLVYNQ